MDAAGFALFRGSASSLGVAATAFVEFAEEASAIRASSQAVQIFGLRIDDRMCPTRPAADCKSLFLYTLSVGWNID